MAAVEERKTPASVSFMRPAIPAVHRGHVKLGFVDLDAWMLCEWIGGSESGTSWFHSSP